ncbi:putative X-linked retinitis pigmentosa GTPase regulator-interacting protein 1 [Trichinella spiralis]|uniref:putative X-linked retinitis pigmentosa GTPase regulator-interacting protein 1 n=1 Tax=Trichinella spiralis TaxID=6334 RepID=UPI0001EFCF52|nr:putative X-linked retinitis pigmentosa GTPase regulator-interacting protein 1 [Trichinella spiralis]
MLVSNVTDFSSKQRIDHRLVVLGREITVRVDLTAKKTCVVNDLQNEQKTIISNVYYAVLLTTTTKNHNTTDSSPEPHTSVRTPSGSNVPSTVAECYDVVVHDQLGLS